MESAEKQRTLTLKELEKAPEEKREILKTALKAAGERKRGRGRTRRIEDSIALAKLAREAVEAYLEVVEWSKRAERRRIVRIKQIFVFGRIRTSLNTDSSTCSVIVACSESRIIVNKLNGIITFV